jgi:hypothetical protein
VVVFGGWAIGRLGWAEPEPSLPALRRLLRLARVRLPLVVVSIGAYLSWWAVMLYLSGVSGMVGGWLWSSAVLSSAGLVAWAGLRPLPRARQVVTVITVMAGAGIGYVMAAAGDMSPDRLASAIKRVEVPETWTLLDEDRSLSPICLDSCSSASRTYLAPGDVTSVGRQTAASLRGAGYRSSSVYRADEDLDGVRGRVSISAWVSTTESRSVAEGGLRPLPPGHVSVTFWAQTH